MTELRLRARDKVYSSTVKALAATLHEDEHDVHEALVSLSRAGQFAAPIYIEGMGQFSVTLR